MPARNTANEQPVTRYGKRAQTALAAHRQAQIKASEQ